MKKDECKELLKVIKMNYRNFYKDLTVDEANVILNTWLYQFGNIPFEVMQKALMDYIATEPAFPPSVAHLNKIIYGMTQTDQLGADESFDKVLKLIQRYGSNARGFKLACNEFNDIERLIINEGYFKELGQSTTSVEVMRGQYARRYENRRESHERNGRIELPNTNVLKLINDRKMIE